MGSSIGIGMVVLLGLIVAAVMRAGNPNDANECVDVIARRRG
jgi:hypothetical protein